MNTQVVVRNGVTPRGLPSARAGVELALQKGLCRQLTPLCTVFLCSLSRVAQGGLPVYRQTCHPREPVPPSAIPTAAGPRVPS